VHGPATGLGSERRPTGCGLFRAAREDYAGDSSSQAASETECAVILLFTAMFRYVLLDIQGHETRSLADLTDRDRDESSRRAMRLGAHESADAGLMRSADTCPDLSPAQEAAVRVQDVMTKGVKTIAPTAAPEDAWNLMRLNHITIWSSPRQTESLASCRIAMPAGGAAPPSGRSARLPTS
jgi:hypothetical protein